MKKIFLFDDFDFELVICRLMGLDSEGNPQMVVTTPGMTVESLDYYQEYYYGDGVSLYYLCEEGEIIPSKTALRLLAGYMFVANKHHDNLSELIKSLEMNGLKWCDDFVNLIFEVSSAKDSDGNPEVCLMVYLDDNMKSYVTHSHRFKTLRQTITHISQFVSELRSRANILTSCTLSISEDLKKELKNTEKDVFDRISSCHSA